MSEIKFKNGSSIKAMPLDNVITVGVDLAQAGSERTVKTAYIRDLNTGKLTITSVKEVPIIRDHSRPFAVKKTQSTQS